MGKKAKNNTLFMISLIILLGSVVVTLYGRSALRAKDPHVPTLSVSWQDDAAHACSLSSYHLQEYPFFNTYDHEFFHEHLLPATPISFRNNDAATVDGQHLSELVETLLDEIKQKKKEYTHFEVLMNKDFNRRKGWGLLVARFKKYPFVVKLFIETPESFSSPWGKGMTPVFLFYLGGGVNRHLAGFTRVTNSEHIKERLNSIALTELTGRISVPRKWYWLPKKSRWLTLTGTNFSLENNMAIHKEIPATYGIIADMIESERIFSATSKEDSAISLKVCNALGMCTDPHSNNFMLEKGTNKIVIIDTEHFPTIVGLDVQKEFNGYLPWYTHLISKCGKAMFFSTKQELRAKSKHNLSLAPRSPSASAESKTQHDPERTPPPC